MVIGGTLPLLGVVAAFGLAPNTLTERVPLRHVIDDVAITLPAPAAGEDSQLYWREERIQRGDTVASLLSRLEVDDPQASDYLRSARDLRWLRGLVPGRALRAVTTDAGKLVALRYLHAGGNELVVRRDGDAFKVFEQPVEAQPRLVMASGEIKTSLFAATDEVGLSDAVAVQLADIFSSEVDFHRSLQPGDRFSLVYEALFSGADLVRSGRILAAEFVNGGRAYRALYFEDSNGRGGYYTPDGKSVRKAFLRSPLEFSRNSSGLSQSRYHPILRVWRAHKGVDYAAPTGARVKATADGYVQFVGRQGGYGNVVVLTHSNGYQTLYAHLSSFSRSLVPGRRIAQGDVIGHVGSTGFATGPHLHYEFRRNGVHQNPLHLALPGAASITRDLRAAFEGSAAALLERLDLIRGLDLAMVN